MTDRPLTMAQRGHDNGSHMNRRERRRDRDRGAINMPAALRPASRMASVSQPTKGLEGSGLHHVWACMLLSLSPLMLLQTSADSARSDAFVGL